MYQAEQTELMTVTRPVLCIVAVVVLPLGRGGRLVTRQICQSGRGQVFENPTAGLGSIFRLRLRLHTLFWNVVVAFLPLVVTVPPGLATNLIISVSFL